SLRSLLFVLLDARRDSIVCEADAYALFLPRGLRAGHGIAVGSLHERVTALERALRIVPAQGDPRPGEPREPGPLRVARASRDPGAHALEREQCVGRGRAGGPALAREHERVTGGALFAARDPARGGGTDLAQQLVQAQALGAHRARGRTGELDEPAAAGAHRGARAALRGECAGVQLPARLAYIDAHQLLGSVRGRRAAHGRDIV